MVIHILLNLSKENNAKNLTFYIDIQVFGRTAMLNTSFPEKIKVNPEPDHI